ncbi:MAG: NADP-dependent malic enzyme [Bacteriovoracaceae bacterium]|jgi:malate dehydrogenase (oxaloacetate-decarboxylating)(NADP+)|nr:NADP-dependent malic enzyme [Bacteriovoracaceae bacterium]
MSKDQKDEAALEYHRSGRPGKIEVIPTKPCQTARDLSLAYSPGVALPCLEIAKDPETAYQYTSKGNLVAVVSNGSAVLGLGNIGALASKPVMEGKGILFKRFADIDVFDIELNASTVEEMVQHVKALEPTFGGINLEDIKAPECFEVERQLKEIMDIPVFHDDQHGTAIIASAAFINAAELASKELKSMKIVFSGAGAASIACAKLFFKMGVDPKNLTMCDSKGAIYIGRKEGMNKYKDEFAVETDARTLEDAMRNADAFIGCSARGVLTKEMVKTMAKDPIIFAMANPDPEIYPEEVAEVRDDAIMATGRSDYPNQVNNVLGFPFIFRGALDVRATKINEEMKLAAVYAISALAKEEVPDEVKKAYGNSNFSFGRNYLIPKPFDRRVLTRVSPAIAKAAIDSGVARIKITDFRAYAKSLSERLGTTGAFTRSLRERIDTENPPTLVFAEGEHSRILRAASIIKDEGIITPLLLGNRKVIEQKISKLGLENLESVKIISPENDEHLDKFSDTFFAGRKRKGVSRTHAKDLMEKPNYFGSMMVRTGMADGMITGATRTYPECIKPIMRVAGTTGPFKAAGIYILLIKKRVLFFADCTLQTTPDAKDLSDIARSTSALYRKLMLKSPRVAFLSFSSFGSSKHPEATKIRKAVELTKQSGEDMIIDGEMQADAAVNFDIMKEFFDFTELDSAADILIFPNLHAANISYKLLVQLGDAKAIGPIIVPMDHPINVLQRTSSVEEIVNMATVTALMAQQENVK